MRDNTPAPGAPCAAHHQARLWCCPAARSPRRVHASGRHPAMMAASLCAQPTLPSPDAVVALGVVCCHLTSEWADVAGYRSLPHCAETRRRPTLPPGCCQHRQRMVVRRRGEWLRSQGSPLPAIRPAYSGAPSGSGRARGQSRQPSGHGLRMQRRVQCLAQTHTFGR